MYRLLFPLFWGCVFVSCKDNLESIRLPEELTVTSSGQNIDSLIKANKYTALVLFCDHCGKGISNLSYWDDIVRQNARISPLIILKSKNPKLVETYLDIYNINYPRVVYNYDTLRTLNSQIELNTVILIDRSYHIIHQTLNPENTFTTWKYIHLYN